MDRETKTITKDESLKLLGLFTLAIDYYAKLREVEFALNRALGKAGNDQGDLSDAIYQDKTSPDEFYTALEREGFVVSEEAPGFEVETGENLNG